ncbi:MAG: ABC transporter permease [Chloroflexi bacterium]|nr:ABC transporter permease [Chloroflexota bacterium]
MQVPEEHTLTLPDRLRARRPGPLRKVAHFLRTRPLGALGVALILLVLLSTAAAPALTAKKPEEVFRQQVLRPPSAEFPLGTDNLGRDVFSRTLYGARISLLVGVLVALFSVSLGSLLGIASAYVGRSFDLLVQRLVDILMSLPGLILALALMAALGQSLQNVVLALVISQIPSSIRVIRSAALGVLQNQYIEAARALGASGTRVALVHLLPNVVPPIIVVASIVPGGAIIAEASLSFLGLGVPANVPTWGGMLGGSVQRFATSAPWIVVFPGLAISITVLGINLLGDALRDALDPRLRGR